MAEPTEEKKTPTKAVQNRDGAVAEALGDTLDKRLQKITGQDEKKKGLGKFFSFGDSTKTILKSVEASMFVQTEFLEDISSTLSEQLSIQKGVADDQDRRDRLESVSGDEADNADLAPTPDAPDKTFFDKIKEKIKDKTSSFVPQEEDSLSKKLLKSMGLILGGGYIASGLGKNLSEKAFKKIPGVSDEGADKASTITGDALGTGTSVGIGVTLLKKFGLTRIGGLKAFATAAVAKATYDTIGELDVDKDGKLMGIKKELVQGVGAGIAGVMTFVGMGKSFMALGTAVKGALNFAKSKLGVKVPKPDIPKPTKAPNIEQLTKGANNKVPKVTTTSSKVAKTVSKIPSAISVNTGGVSSAPNLTTVDAVGDAVKASKPERFAKFSKFFRFAGPAAGIIPALIEPALAIYRDESDSVVRREIAGAVGSISGASLGMIAGGSAGTALGLGAAGVGAVPGGIIGGFIGGLGGAFAGEWLAEKVTDALMGGSEIDPKDMNKLIDEKKDKSGGITPSVKVSNADTGPSAEQKVSNAQVKADDAGKALSDFESTAKSGRKVTETDEFGFETTKTVFDDAAEQAQFNKLSDAKFDADYAVEDATSEMITGDSFNVPGQFEKLQFLQEKGFLPEGESKIEMGKFVGGPLSGMTPDEAISMYAAQEASFSKSAAEFKAGDKSIPTIEADPTKTMTADGKIPAKIVQETATPVSAELKAAQDKTTASFQAMKDFETENASMMTKEDRGAGFTATKFSDPEKQKEYDALMDQAQLDQEAVKRQKVREAVGRGKYDAGFENITEQGNLLDFRENEAASLNALKELKVAEKARDDAMMEAENTQDPILKQKAEAKAEELRLAANDAKSKYRDTNRAQLGKNQENNRSRYSDQRETLMTEYNMNDAEMKKLGISENKSSFGPTTKQRMNLDAFKRQKDEEKLEMMSKGVTGVESMPDKLISRTKAISEDKATQDSQAKGIMMQNLNKAGDSVTNTNVGGSSNTVNIVSGGGGRSLANHTPVSQSG